MMTKLMKTTKGFQKKAIEAKEKMIEPTISISRENKEFRITVTGKEDELDLMISALKHTIEEVNDKL